MRDGEVDLFRAPPCLSCPSSRQGDLRASYSCFLVWLSFHDVVRFEASDNGAFVRRVGDEGLANVRSKDMFALSFRLCVDAFAEGGVVSKGVLLRFVGAGKIVK